MLWLHRIVLMGCEWLSSTIRNCKTNDTQVLPSWTWSITTSTHSSDYSEPSVQRKRRYPVAPVIRDPYSTPTNKVVRYNTHYSKVTCFVTQLGNTLRLLLVLLVRAHCSKCCECSQIASIRPNGPVARLPNFWCFFLSCWCHVLS